MKTQLLLPTILLLAFATANSFGQIPNYEFEQWWTVGSCQIPTDYFTYNLTSAGSFYPISRDTSHYPASIGAASIRLENKTSLLPANESKGIIVSSLQLVTMPSFQMPSFQLTGHPNSLTGYYKYAPQNGDTMWIALVLFQSGVIVSQGTFYSSVTTPGWAPFNIPVSAYTTADSAEIIISAFNADQPTKVPLGNSILNIDNLNFDNLITGITDIDDENKISVYPNPFFFETTLQTTNILKNATLTVYNSYGQQVKQIKNISGQTVTLFRDNLPSGLYFIRLTQDSKVITADKLVITD